MPGMDVPQYKEFYNPTLKAIRHLGGSGSIPEIVETVIEQMQLPDTVAQQPHGEGPMTEVEYRLAWARTYLKGTGLITNSSRGVWVLTPEGSVADNLGTRVTMRSYPRQQREPTEPVDDETVRSDEESSWQETLIEVLLSLDPSSFERLCRRLLRESGFIEVEVIGRSGDGGIDGRGIIRLAGLIGFPVLFQCKRYAGIVTPSQIRDFRGAMTGRADKGLFITTGRFTREAQAEATRDGVPPIDLIDGNSLVDKLKELGLGVTTRQVELVEVNADWFATI